MNQQPQMPGDRAPMMGQQKPVTPKWLWITLIIVVLIGGAFAAWYYLMGPGKAVESSTATTTTTPVDETADWKTYTSNTYKFSFKYPTDLTVTNDSVNLISLTFADRERINVFVQKNGSNLSVADWLKANFPNVTSSSITVGNLKGLKASNGIFLPISDSSILTLVYEQYEGPGGESYGKNHVETFDQILSTFQFTK